MSSNDGQEAKYVYKYTFVPEKKEAETSESSKEVQAYVSSMLGVKSKARETI